jgi:hypothetical protein
MRGVGHKLEMAGEAFEVFGEAGAFAEPCECAFEKLEWNDLSSNRHEALFFDRA